MARAAGFTLVEVVVASLLLLVITVPIMSAALGGRSLTARTNRRLAAAGAMRRVSEELKAYVVADASLAQGPGSGGDGWALPGDQSGLRALAAGHHELTPSVFLPSLAGAPYNAVLAYDVAVRQTPQGPQPDVVFDASWSEP